MARGTQAINQSDQTGFLSIIGCQRPGEIAQQYAGNNTWSQSILHSTTSRIQLRAITWPPGGAHPVGQGPP